MGTRGRGHCGTGGVWPVDGRHIGEIFCFPGKRLKLALPSLLLLFCLGEDWRRGCSDGVSLGVTGMGRWDPDSRFMLSGCLLRSWLYMGVTQVRSLDGSYACGQALVATRYTASWLWSTYGSRISKSLPGSQGRKRTEKSQKGKPGPGRETTHVIANPGRIERMREGGQGQGSDGRAGSVGMDPYAM